MQHPLNHTLRTLTSLLLASGIALAVPLASAQELSTKDLTPVQRPMADLEPPYDDDRGPPPEYDPGPPPASRPQASRPPQQSSRPPQHTSAPRRNRIDVTAWVDHSDNTYAFGENVVLNVKTNRDAYLTIVDVGTSGRVHVIFPNRIQTDNRIRAGEILQVPGRQADFNLEVHGPAGTELIKVIASLDPAPLFRAGDLEPAGPFKALKERAPAVAKDLQVVLREPRHRDWASYNKVIRIVPN